MATSATQVSEAVGEADVEAVRRRVLNVIGHELRTPVTTLHGLATQVAGAEDLRAVREVLGPALMRNAARLERLLDDLLVAAGVSTALPVSAPSPQPLAGTARSLWREWTGEDLPVRGDARLCGLAPDGTVEWALAHILDNAARYGDTAPQVTVERAGATAVISVEAPGVTPHPEEVRLACELFFRGEHAVTAGPGLGIGLTVVRALADAAGGAVTFAARPAGGTVTCLTLPVAGPVRERS